jgi:hypothetical protein
MFLIDVASIQLVLLLQAAYNMLVQLVRIGDALGRAAKLILVGPEHVQSKMERGDSQDGVHDQFVMLSKRENEMPPAVVEAIHGDHLIADMLGNFEVIC